MNRLAEAIAQDVIGWLDRGARRARQHEGT
jgi:hypothetical protein